MHGKTLEYSGQHNYGDGKGATAADKNTHYVRRIGVFDLKKVHRSDHGLHGHEYVLVYEFNKPPLVVVRVAGAVDDSHLFDERGFAGLTSACNRVLSSLTLTLPAKASFEYQHFR